MIKHRRLMRGLATACNAGSLMAAGALLLALYLAVTNPLFDRPLGMLRASLLLLMSVCAALRAGLAPTDESNAGSYMNPGWSGVAFVVATGLAGFAFTLWISSSAGGYLVAATILIATAVVAARLWPFAAEDADEANLAGMAGIPAD